MPWRHTEEWRYSSAIFYSGTRWMCQFHAPAALPLGKSPRYPLGRRLGGPQSWYGLCGEERKFASARNQTPVMPPHSYTDCSMEWVCVRYGHTWFAMPWSGEGDTSARAMLSPCERTLIVDTGYLCWEFRTWAKCPRWVRAHVMWLTWPWVSRSLQGCAKYGEGRAVRNLAQEEICQRFYSRHLLLSSVDPSKDNVSSSRIQRRVVLRIFNRRFGGTSKKLASLLAMKFVLISCLDYSCTPKI
jgi:hypothetical protein